MCVKEMAENEDDKIVNAFINYFTARVKIYNNNNIYS